MPDVENVIKGLECCIGQFPGEDYCKTCSYQPYRFGKCKTDAITDALALLKEQQSKIEQLTDDKDLLKDTIYMLKAQKHCETFTVIDTKTGKEADIYNIALHEEWANHLCYCDMEGWAIENDGTLLLVDECGQSAYADRERFKVVWDA